MQLVALLLLLGLVYWLLLAAILTFFITMIQSPRGPPGKARNRLATIKRIEAQYVEMNVPVEEPVQELKLFRPNPNSRLPSGAELRSFYYITQRGASCAPDILP